MTPIEAIEIALADAYDASQSEEWLEYIDALKEAIRLLSGPRYFHGD